MHRSDEVVDAQVLEPCHGASTGQVEVDRAWRALRLPSSRDVNVKVESRPLDLIMRGETSLSAVQKSVRPALVRRPRGIPRTRDRVYHQVRAKQTFETPAVHHGELILNIVETLL